jgi:hypothetical protein
VAAIASIVVAIATLGVVIATFRAARSAQDAANAAVRSAQATEGLLSAQLLPQIVDVPWQDLERADDVDRPRYPGSLQTALPRRAQLVVAVDQGVGFFSVPIRNVGPGLAQIRGVLFYVQDANVTHADFDVSTSLFIPSGEQTRISVVLRPGHPSLEAFANAIRVGFEIVVRVHYSAAGNDAQLETTLIASCSEDHWRVQDLAFGPRRPEGAPFDSTVDWPWERDPIPPDGPPLMAA